MTNEQGLVLFYLGDLRVRAHGLCLSLDLKLVYVQELFLSFAEGSFYAKMAAENGARILAMVDGAPLAKPISVVKARKLVVLDGPPREWAVRLAIFADPNVKRWRSEALLVMPDGRLITWGPDMIIRLETARAPAITELITRAAAETEPGEGKKLH